MGLSPHLDRCSGLDLPNLQIRLRLVCVWLFCLDVPFFLSGHPISFGFWVWSFAWIVLMSWLGASIDCFVFCVCCAFANPCACVLSVSIPRNPWACLSIHPASRSPHLPGHGSRPSHSGSPNFLFLRPMSQFRNPQKKKTNKPRVIASPFLFFIFCFVFKCRDSAPGR
jgi:hypothetical protein